MKRKLYGLVAVILLTIAMSMSAFAAQTEDIPLDDTDKAALQELLNYCQSTDDAAKLINYVEGRLTSLYQIGEKYFTQGNVLFDGENLTLNGSGTGLVIKDQNVNNYRRDASGNRTLIGVGSTPYIYVGEFTDGIPDGKVKCIAMEHTIFIDGSGREDTGNGRVVTAEVSNGIWNGQVTTELMDEYHEQHKIVEKASGNYINGIMNGVFTLTRYEDNYHSNDLDGQAIPGVTVTYQLNVVNGMLQYSDSVRDSGYDGMHLILTDPTGTYSAYTCLFGDEIGYIGDFITEQDTWTYDFLH